jgi:acyl-CoA reductase-like NAD-dependent aldehyde dehydrogenase
MIPFNTAEEVESAVAKAFAVAPELAALPAHRRAAALDHVSRRLAERAEEFAQAINDDSGKPLKWARVEVTRAISTFRWAAEEARRFSGELQRLDTDPSAEGRLALVRRVPRGPVLGIAPFNFPLNLVAHKVDPRLPVVSFTGSGPVGWGIKERVPRKHVTLELGGNAAAIVAPDWQDLEFAAQRIATFAMYQAGQSCISVQRVYVHTDIYDALSEAVVQHVNKLDVAGDVGPLINDAAADRVEAWVNEASATVLTGGTRDGRVYAPTVLADVPEDAKVSAEEVFGPVVTLTRVDSVEEVFDRVNASRYGLQAGLFTNDVRLAFRAAQRLQVGGVIVGDVPSYRADQMPYGGVKESGIGREGLRAAMEDLTEPRVLVLTGLAL